MKKNGGMTEIKIPFNEQKPSSLIQRVRAMRPSLNFTQRWWQTQASPHSPTLRRTWWSKSKNAWLSIHGDVNHFRDISRLATALYDSARHHGNFDKNLESAMHANDGRIYGFLDAPLALLRSGPIFAIGYSMAKLTILAHRLIDKKSYRHSALGWHILGYVIAIPTYLINALLLMASVVLAVVWHATKAVLAIPLWLGSLIGTTIAHAGSYFAQPNRVLRQATAINHNDSEDDKAFKSSFSTFLAHSAAEDKVFGIKVEDGQLELSMSNSLYDLNEVDSPWLVPFSYFAQHPEVLSALLKRNDFTLLSKAEKAEYEQQHQNELTRYGLADNVKKTFFDELKQANIEVNPQTLEVTSTRIC